MPDYDGIVIGAGLSGLAAAIRLAYSGRRVAVFERHWAPGGLNSYYHRHGVSVDVGLHALTNLSNDTDRSAPINKLIRQLKLKRQDLHLEAQNYSEIQFPEATLRFSNDLQLLQSEIERLFPQDSENFRSFCQEIGGYSYTGEEIPQVMVRSVLAEKIQSPLLREMLLCPVMFYGNPAQYDMTYQQYCTMFKSLFLEGMGRPHEGMEPLIHTLVEQLKALGGEIFFNKGVKRLHISDNQVTQVELDDGTCLTATGVISSIGGGETGRLCSCDVPELSRFEAGRIGFVESIFNLSCLPEELGIHASIIFRNEQETFDFRTPSGSMDFRSQIICFPGNFTNCQDIPAAKSVRITTLASPDWWLSQPPEAYRQAKAKAADKLKALLAVISPKLPDCVTDWEVSTPKTIVRFTGHDNGAIYGSPTRYYAGITSCSNLYLCGTDQGFLGIVGSLMSGTVMGNQMILNVK